MPVPVQTSNWQYSKIRKNIRQTLHFMQKISEYVCSLTLTAEVGVHRLLLKTHTWKFKKLAEKLEEGCAKKQAKNESATGLYVTFVSKPKLPNI